MNKCIFSGRLASDVDIRENATTTVAKFRMAVKRRFTKQGDPDADFINITAFGKSAENIGKYFSKGSSILVETHMQTGSYEKRDGSKVYTTDFIVDSFDFMDKKSDSTKEPAGDTGFVPVEDDLDLPFA